VDGPDLQCPLPIQDNQVRSCIHIQYILYAYAKHTQYICNTYCIPINTNIIHVAYLAPSAAVVRREAHVKELNMMKDSIIFYGSPVHPTKVCARRAGLGYVTTSRNTEDELVAVLLVKYPNWRDVVVCH
jgi:hypothetical protein